MPLAANPGFQTSLSEVSNPGFVKVRWCRPGSGRGGQCVVDFTDAIDFADEVDEPSAGLLVGH